MLGLVSAYGSEFETVAPACLHGHEQGVVCGLTQFRVGIEQCEGCPACLFEPESVP